MKTALADLLSSKKFVTMIVGLVVAIGARKGLDVDPEITAAIIGLFAVLIGAQGAADHGKEAAKVKADGWKPIDVEIDEPTDPAKPISEAVKSSILITLLGVLALVMVLAAGCGAAERVGRVARGTVDCMTPAAVSAINTYGLAVATVLRHATADDGSVDWSPVKAIAKKLRDPAARCVLAAAVDEALHPSNPDPDAPQAEAQLVNAASLLVGFEEVRAELFDGARFQLDGRTL